MESPVPTGLQLSVLDKQFREDPYPVLAELRRREPIHFDTQLQRYVFTRHDDVAAILRNPHYWSDPRKGRPGSFTREFLGQGDEEPSMLLMDEPGHRRLRELVRHPFTPRAVERWRDRAREVAERTIAALPAEGEFELVSSVSGPIPTIVIAELLGVDPDRHADFKSWGDAMIAVSFNPAAEPGDVAIAERAREALGAFFLEEIESRRRTPGDDLVTALVEAEVDGDRLTDHEIVLQCNLLLLAGNLTTTDLIGNAVMALLRHPDQLEKLRARPDLMKNAVEEVLRYDTPVTNSGRIAHEDLVIDGVEIGQGESLSVSLAAANRDPAVYPDPDRFDIEREDVHHHAFGGGRHFCLGAHLARLEAAEALAALLDRYPHLEPGDRGQSYAVNPSFRGFSECWVRGAATSR
ncbi:MAG: cytochrome P450 [Myxococcota bacterium]